MLYFLCTAFSFFFPIFLFFEDLKKAKWYQIVLALLIPTLALTSLAIWQYNIIIPVGYDLNVNLSVFIGASYLANIFIFKHKFTLKHALSIVGFFLIEYVTTSLFCYFTDASHEIINDFYTYDYILDTYIFVYAIIFWSVNSLIHFVSESREQSKAIYFIVISLAFFLVFYLIFMQSFDIVPKDNEDYYLYNIAFNIAFVIIIVFVIFILLYYSNELVKKEVALQTKIRDDLNIYYNQSLLLSQEELIKIRHDIKNVLAIAQMNDPKLYDQLKEKIGTYDQVFYCKEIILNKILIIKNREATEKGIKFEATANGLEKLPMKELDSISLFTNIIDNAIRAAAMTDEKKVMLEILHEDNSIFIHLTNSCDGIVKKKDQVYHGKGTQIINEIVSRYNGKVSRKLVGRIFTTDIELNFDTK